MPGEVRLESARERDARRISDMSRTLIEQGLRWRWGPRSIASCIRDPESEVLVARDDSRIVGFSIMSFRFVERQAHLLLLAVEPARRREGIGRAMVEWLEKLARAGGITQVGLEVRATNARARGFYRRLGYGEGELLRGYYQQREDALRMDRDLRRPVPAAGASRRRFRQ